MRLISTKWNPPPTLHQVGDKMAVTFKNFTIVNALNHLQVSLLQELTIPHCPSLVSCAFKANNLLEQIQSAFGKI
jgi:hypothetical protein